MITYGAAAGTTIWMVAPEMMKSMATPASNTILGGHGNDVIYDGEGASDIDTGPGRNRVISQEGDDTIRVGTGENTITGGSGKTRYVIAYGGLTRITDWHPDVQIDLTDWPGAPDVTETDSAVQIHLGASFVVLEGITNVDAVMGDAEVWQRGALSMAKKSRYMIVTAMKNEGPYILDWVAHHMSLGFDHFLVVTNDCNDGTDRILDRLAELGHVTHVPNPKMLRRNEGQLAGHRRCAYAKLFNVYRDAEWIFHSDVDEFLQVNLPEKNARCFLETGRRMRCRLD